MQLLQFELTHVDIENGSYTKSFWGCIKMRPWLRIGSIAVLGLIVLTQFINCDVSQQPLVEAPDSASCVVEPCNTTPQPKDGLEILAPIAIEVRSTAVEYDFGGDCNPSSFSSNAVTWRVFSETGSLVNECMNLDGSCGRCDLGRYTVYLRFAGPQTGWSAEVKIVGIEGGYYFEGNPGKSSKRIAISTLSN